MFSKNSKVLIIAPHSDDETVGCGGTIAKLVKLGAKVHVMLVVATDINGTLGETRLIEFEHACKSLGTNDMSVFLTENMSKQQYGFSADAHLDQVPIKDLIHAIEYVVDAFRPDTVFVTKGGYHQDHQVVENAVFAALRPSRSFCPSNLLLYEQPTLIWGREAMKPTLYVDISNEIDAKIRALRCHKSQMDKQELLMNEYQIKRWAEVRGIESRCKHAEAFEIVRLIL